MSGPSTWHGVLSRSLYFQNANFVSMNLASGVIQVQTGPNEFGWRQTLYQNCSPRQDLQLCSWKVFELKLFRVPKYCCKCADFEIWNLKLSNNLGCWHGLYESYSYQYDLKICSWKVFYLNLVSQICVLGFLFQNL